MNQAMLDSAHVKRYSKGREATTMVPFDDSGDFAATAWQGDVPRSAHLRSRTPSRWLASSATSAAFVVFMLPADVAGSDLSTAANVSSGNLEQLSLGAAATSFSEEIYGVYAPPRPRKVLHSEVVEFQTDKLPRRKPRITADDSFLAAIDDD